MLGDPSANTHYLLPVIGTSYNQFPLDLVQQANETDQSAGRSPSRVGPWAQVKIPRLSLHGEHTAAFSRSDALDFSGSDLRRLYPSGGWAPAGRNGARA